MQKMMINEVELAERWNSAGRRSSVGVAKADPAGQYRSLRQALASLPA